MILTSELDTVNSINESWLRESLKKEVNVINESTDIKMEIYNNKPNHFTIVVNGSLEYMLDTTDYTAELIKHVSTFSDEILLAAIIDASNNFEDKLAIHVISTVYHTL